VSVVLLDGPVYRHAYDLEAVVVDIPEAIIFAVRMDHKSTKPAPVHGISGGRQPARTGVELGR
jgi:hypothetical protein